MPDHLPPCAAGGSAVSRYAVSLIDRRSGRPHRIAGIPLVLMTREPGQVAHELMRHRDRDRWHASIEPMTPKGAIP